MVKAYRVASEFMYRYNNNRIHSGVRYMSPAEFYEKNQRQECAQLKEIKLLLFFSHLTFNNHYTAKFGSGVNG